MTPLERLQAALRAANGKRRVRTLHMDDVLQAIHEAVRDAYGYRNGGTVANAYKYPAIQTCVLAATRTNGDVMVCVGIAYANKGAAPRPRVLAREIPTITVDSPRVRTAVRKWANRPKKAHAAICVPRRLALRAIAERRRLARAKVALRLPEVTPYLHVEVTREDSLRAGNCPMETGRVARWWPGQTSVPAPVLWQRVLQREPELTTFAWRAIVAAAEREKEQVQTHG